MNKLERLTLHAMNMWDPASREEVNGFSAESVRELETAFIELPNVRVVEYNVWPKKNPWRFCFKPKVEEFSMLMLGRTILPKLTKTVQNEDVNFALRKLHLNFQKPASDVALMIGDWFYGGPCIGISLETFILRFQFPIDPEVLQALAQALATPQATSLRNIQIQSNHGFQQLENTLVKFPSSLETNYSLVSLEFQTAKRATRKGCPVCITNMVTEPLGSEIEFYLKLNWCGRKRVMPNLNDKSSEEMIEVLSMVNQDVRCLYYYLRLKPDLCCRHMAYYAKNERLRRVRTEPGVGKEQMQRLCAEKNKEIQRLRALLAAHCQSEGLSEQQA